MSRNGESLVQTLLKLAARVLALLLWPVKVIAGMLAPPGEYDGLSPAVTEKAAQQFVYHLRSLAATGEHTDLISDVFASTGFASVKEEAFDTNSIIVVYLHSPTHAKATEMCHKLISMPLLSFLSNAHIKTIGVSIYTSQGKQLADNLGVATYPVLAMLQRPPGSRSGPLQLVFKAEGPRFVQISVNQLLPIMNGTLRNHETMVAESEARRIEREQANELRRQQDEEYQESLRADQERERMRLEEQQREEDERLEQQRQEDEAARKEEERLQQAKEMVRPAPASGGTRVRFTLPSGKKLDRRFHDDDTVGVLKAFLQLHFTDNEIDIANIGLSSTYPRKVFDEDDVTLKDGGLSPQAVLMVQDLDA
mmetsp:Transcript_1045/g.2464  ORF Transcript_1045/g.2464 Transcript_1045/m.2464 type:complete len:366 (+) Transcript_1045:95-1192(+)